MQVDLGVEQLQGVDGTWYKFERVARWFAVNTTIGVISAIAVVIGIMINTGLCTPSLIASGAHRTKRLRTRTKSTV